MSLTLFVGFFVITLTLAFMKPGFWRFSEFDFLTIAAFSGFFGCLGIYTWVLIDGLKGTWKASAPAGDYFFVFAFGLFRLVYETIINVNLSSIPSLIQEIHRPLFALLLGGGILFQSIKYQVKNALDTSSVIPQSQFYIEYGLTERESEIVAELCSGISTKECAEKLFISEKTVNSHLHHIFRKCHVTSRSQLLARMRQTSQTIENHGLN